RIRPPTVNDTNDADGRPRRNICRARQQIGLAGKGRFRLRAEAIPRWTQWFIGSATPGVLRRQSLLTGSWMRCPAPGGSPPAAAGFAQFSRVRLAPVLRVRGKAGAAVMVAPARFFR